MKLADSTERTVPAQATARLKLTRLLSRRYGLEFIRFVLEMLWFRSSEDAFLRGARCTSTFHTYINQLSNSLVRFVARMLCNWNDWS